ncbi:MAG: hypothetical protein U0K19_03495 [Bifidobacteriaceae bacterium]|nr:hypothetical protein [Bifidobacteriaceae bacterium]
MTPFTNLDLYHLVTDDPLLSDYINGGYASIHADREGASHGIVLYAGPRPVLHFEVRNVTDTAITLHIDIHIALLPHLDDQPDIVQRFKSTDEIKYWIGYACQRLAAHRYPSSEELADAIVELTEGALWEKAVRCTSCVNEDGFILFTATASEAKKPYPLPLAFRMVVPELVKQADDWSWVDLAVQRCHATDAGEVDVIDWLPRVSYPDTASAAIELSRMLRARILGWMNHARE